ncbi:MAG: hypothetical protein AABZ83_00030, partial [candidate division NC10 bacterium]
MPRPPRARRSRTSISTSRLVLRLLARRFRGLRGLGTATISARHVVVAGFALLFWLVMLGEYVVFRRGLDELVEIRLAGTALALYFLESVLVLILIISLVSYVASGLWIYYRAGDTRLLLASPLPLGGIYGLRALETFLLTSWALALVGLPALLALGRAHGRLPGFYLQGLGILGLFAVLIGAAGALLTAAAGGLFRRSPTRLAVAVSMAALVGAFTLLIGKNVIPSAGD